MPDIAPTPPPVLSPASTLAPPLDPARRRELAEAAADHYSRLNGAQELQAAVLALLLPTDSKRALRAWEVECEATPRAAELRAHAAHLPASARLPWFETLVSRLRGQPLPTRQALLAATRRVMGARGVVRPIDRLHWLAMRQRLGEATAAATHAPAASDLSRLPQSDVSAIAMYSAFLSRMVPVDLADAGAGEAAGSASPSPGQVWYERVMTPWKEHATIPRCESPDTDGVVYALQVMQSLPWMQRPTLVRGWVVAAQQHSRRGNLSDGAADALRLSSALLDSPLPPELARHYGAEPQAAPR